VVEPGLTIASLHSDSGERFRSLRRELGVSAFGLNLITLQPRQRGRIHAHADQEEVYVVLEGELTLVADERAHALRRGQLVRVAPAVRRQLVNHGSERLVLLALGGSGEHHGRDGRAWKAWDERGEGRPPADVPLPDDIPSS
jgi:uncharacterized cupin superfamily protein